MRGAIAILLSVLCVSCGQAEPKFVFLNNAQLLESSSLVLRISGQPTVLAMDTERLPNPLIPDDPLAPGAMLTLEALLYDRPLSKIGIPSGTLLSLAPDEGVPLPKADQILVANVSEKEASPWRVAEAPSETLSDFRIPISTALCKDFMSSVVGLPMGGDLVGVIEQSPTELLVVGSTSIFSLSDALEVRQMEVDISEETPARFTAFYVDEPNKFWLSTHEKLYRAEVINNRVSTSSVAPVPSTYWPVAMVDTETGLLVLTLEGLVFSLDPSNTSWQLVYDFNRPEFTTRVGLAVLPSGTVVLVRASNTPLVFIETDGTITEELIEAEGVGFSALRYVDGLGLLVGSTGGELFLKRLDNTWTQLGSTGLAQELFAIVPFEDGLLIGGTDGNLAQYVEGFGYCPLLLDLANATIRQITPFAGGLLLTGNNLSGQMETPITHLTWGQ